MSLSPSVGARPRALAVLAALFAVASAHAQCPSVIRVPQDAATINAAVAQVCGGTAADIVVGPGTWTMALPQLSAGTALTIRGAGQSKTTITQSAENVQLNPRFGALVMLKDLTVADAIGSDDIGWNIGFDNCLVRDCNGRFLLDGALPQAPDGYVLRDSRFERCETYVFGVCSGYSALRTTFVDCERPILAVRLADCTFTRSIGLAVEVRNEGVIQNCTFDSTVGHAIEVRSWPGGPTAPLTVIDSTFVGNTGTGSEVGGAIYITSGGPTTTVSGCQFSGNSATSGGAIYLSSNQPLNITNCTFTGNSATAGPGGAICQQGGGWIQALAIGSCTFEGNSGLDGGGAIAINGGIGTALINDCSFVENAGGSGGAIATANATVAVTSCGFDGNLSSYGGGIWSEYSVLTVEECAFTENEATATYWEAGGAIEVVLGTAQIERSSFIRNVASSGSGGAIAGNNVNAAYSGMPFRVSQCSFVDNEAAWFGGSVFIHWANTSGVGVFDSEFQGSMAYEGADVMAHSVANEVSLAGCAFRGQPNEAPLAVRTTSPADRGLRASGSSFCGLGSSPFTQGVFDAGGNCVVESCFDSDTNGIPDACQVVSVPGDFGTIQQAIDATPKGGFRIVSVAPGVYAGPILFHGKAVLVRGAGAGATILQGSGGARSSVVRFTGGEPISAGLAGLTVRGGPSGTPFPGNPSVLAGGGVFGFDSAASIRDCIIEQNASGFGGGAYFWQCTGRIERTVFRTNAASADGGGLQLYGGSMQCTDVSVTDNYANGRGGGMHLVEGQPVLTRVDVTGNDANNLAGGISWVPQGGVTSRLVLDACTVTGNVANVASGGIGCVDDAGGAKLELRGTRVCFNVPVPNVEGPYTADASSEVCDCIADITLDGLVNGADLAVLLSAWGSNGGSTPRADCNRDGTVDGTDLAIALGGWGTCPN